VTAADMGEGYIESIQDAKGRDGPTAPRACKQDTRMMIHHEVPLAARMDDGLPTVLQGVIDLVYRTPEGWEVVDYKTDDTEGRLDALVEVYAPQVTAYARQWGRLTVEPVRAGPFFVRSDVVKWVEDG